MNYERWLYENIADLHGKLFIVTGATGTIGKAVVRHLLARNASVVMAVRNIQKAERFKTELTEEFPDSFVKIFRLDLAEFKSLDEFCAEILSSYKYIDCLINLAGIFHLPPQKTEDGFDMHYQVNYLAPLQLTNRLAPLLTAGRTVFVSSLSQSFARVDSDDLESDQVKNRLKVYARSKRLLNDGVKKMQEYYPRMKLNIVHPGVCATELFSEKSGYSSAASKVIGFFVKLLFSRPETCALSIVFAATNDLERGKWVHPRIFGIWGKPKVTRYKQ